MKTCSKCKLDKDESEFAKNITAKDGLRTQCKQCRNNLIKIQKDKINPNRKIYRTKYSDLYKFGNGINEIYLNKYNIARVDKEDYQMLIKYIWHISSNGYACSQKIRMHRLIMNAKEGEVVDHINGNTLDNRKCNLRICSQLENCRHKVKLSTNNKSGKIGVHWKKSKNKWVARIHINKKEKFLGYFDDINSAIDARKEAEIKYFGEFAPHK